MAAIDDYLLKANVQRLLFVEITQGGTVFYLSDSFYATESGDTPASVPFAPIIGDGGLPSYRTSLGDVLAPRASASVGDLNLADIFAMSLVNGGGPAKRNIVSTVKRGATVVCKLGGPRNQFAYAEAVTLFTARVRNIGGSDDGGIRITLDTPARSLFDAMTSGEIGIYGTVLNAPLRLQDFATQRYFTHPGGPITAVDAVYDDTVTLTAGSGYSVNTTTGLLTLTATPVGEVTADVRGFPATTVQAIAAQLASPYIGIGPSALPSDAAGYYHGEQRSIASILDELALSCGAFWMVNDAGLLEFRLWSVAGASSDTYTQKQMLGYQFEQAEPIYSSQPYLYSPNWRLQARSRAGANAAHANFIASQGLTGSATATGDGSATTLARLLETFFTTQAPAATVAGRICTLLGVARFIHSTEVPLTRAKQLGDTVAIETNEGLASGFVMSRAIVADGGVPTQRLELLV